MDNSFALPFLSDITDQRYLTDMIAENGNIIDCDDIPPTIGGWGVHK